MSTFSALLDLLGFLVKRKKEGVLGTKKSCLLVLIKHQLNALHSNGANTDTLLFTLAKHRVLFMIVTKKGHQATFCQIGCHARS